MKIMHVLCTDRLSGAENVALDILSSFKDENEVYYVSPDGDINKFVTARGVTFVPCNTDSLFELKRAYRRIRPDIVHAHDPRMSFKCALAGIPFVSHLHNNCVWMKKINVQSVALLFAVKNARAVITVSPSIEKEYIFSKYFGKKHYMILNTVDAEKVRRMSDADFDDGFDIVFTGRLTEQKQPLLFLDIVKKVTKQVPGLKVVMIGEGDLENEVKKKISDEKIENVKMWGFDSNPYRIIKNSRLCVMTSLWEGFGLVAVESMILAKPVVATAVGGLCEFVDSDCGELCNTAEEVEKAVVELLTDSERYKRASASALEKSKHFTDTSAYKSAIVEVYKSIIK